MLIKYTTMKNETTKLNDVIEATIQECKKEGSRAAHRLQRYLIEVQRKLKRFSTVPVASFIPSKVESNTIEQDAAVEESTPSPVLVQQEVLTKDVPKKRKPRKPTIK